MLDASSFWARLRRRIEAALTQAEDVFNQWTESDRQWWPFAFLRPERDEAFSTLRVALLAVLHGVPLGLLLVLVDSQAHRAATEQPLTRFLVIVCATVFVTNRLTLAYFWNRRAHRLVKQRECLRRWKLDG